MTLREMTDPQAVLQALAEFDRLRRDEFLAKFGFGKSRKYFVFHDGNYYDSKAIVGAAHGYQTGKPLGPKDFSGGERTVMRLLHGLGFEVVRHESV